MSEASLRASMTLSTWYTKALPWQQTLHSYIRTTVILNTADANLLIICTYWPSGSCRFNLLPRFNWRPQPIPTSPPLACWQQPTWTKALDLLTAHGRGQCRKHYLLILPHWWYPLTLADTCKPSYTCDLGYLSDHVPLLAIIPTDILNLRIPKIEKA
jgi:hypothetical protein